MSYLCISPLRHFRRMGMNTNDYSFKNPMKKQTIAVKKTNRGVGDISSLSTFIHSAFARALGLAMFLAISIFVTMPGISQAHCPCTFTFYQIVPGPPPGDPNCVQGGTSCSDCNCYWFELINQSTGDCGINEIDINGPDQSECMGKQSNIPAWLREFSQSGTNSKGWFTAKHSAVPGSLFQGPD